VQTVRNPEHIIVFRDQHTYCAHPAITKTSTGDWLIIFNRSLRREHMLHPPNDPRFYNLMTRSEDEGQNWETPRVVPGYDWHGVECSALTDLSSGDLVLNQWQFRWFPLETAEKLAEEETIWFPPWGLSPDPSSERLEGERAEFARKAADLYPWARANGGAYVHISRNDGRTWPETVHIDTSPYPGGYSKNGGIELPSGEMLLPLTVIPGWNVIYVVRSKDGGRTWSEPFEAASLPGQALNESSVLLLPSGRLLMLMRSGPDRHLYQCFSDDLGYSWDGLSRLPVWGYPPNLMLLPDGRVLCVYGHRREPFSIRAILSEDGGRTWDVDNILVIRDNLRNDDLGYPTSVLLEDGRVFTTYYAQDSEGITCIRGTYYQV